ncbi:MAG: LacI family transcriptional regulator [Rhodocyclaceae bacterium]|jgi:LacI family transcriptional regulator|nr:MAG: LacI family transcriptional regulator [Rhodocyclaceae bacterium]
MSQKQSMASIEKRVTVGDVARLAGVSVGSVSRVLTGKNWVSPEMRKLVQDAAQQLNYVPNSVAQSLKSQRSMTIGALVSDVANPLHGTFLSAAEERLQAAGYMLLVASSHNRVAREIELLKMFAQGRVDGLLLAHTDETNAEIKELLASLPIPVVFHDREPYGLGDAVQTDHWQGAYAATRYLLEMGHRRIALLTPGVEIRPGRVRVSGFEQAIAEAQVSGVMPVIRTLDASSVHAQDETLQLMHSANPPTAIISLGTRMLAGVLTALQSGPWRIPHDVSIIGVGDTELVQLSTPSITAVRWDIAKSGAQAADLLLQRLQSQQLREDLQVLSQAPELGSPRFQCNK